ncbi:protein DMP6-like [Rutidosis leptorrhynchoides]|uniref:protein DMP6-like n=1 Tax=Rutidosis leptorrhynchoides TaxID=125765 RepID=UPI003A99C483
MEVNVENETLDQNIQDEEAPLLDKTLLPEPIEKTLIQKAMSQTFESTAHLANLLPTGSVLAFQLLSPIFTNQGQCDPVSRGMSASLVTLCGLSCVLLNFTDSFVDEQGNLCYGFATKNGLWVIDGTTSLPQELASKYKLKFMDFMHAFMSLMVFAAVALFDQNIVNCFYPSPSDETKELLTTLPVGVGVVFSMLFVVFPTQRHGIGFPISIN